MDLSFPMSADYSFYTVLNQPITNDQRRAMTVTFEIDVREMTTTPYLHSRACLKKVRRKLCEEPFEQEGLLNHV